MVGTQDDVELALSEDDSLPWLESDDQEDEGGLDTTQIVGFALGLLVLTALIIGGLWWWANRDSSDAPIADGSTIEAPDSSYKERPEDPGGKEYAGTGDVAPGVGEGQSRDGRLKEGGSASVTSGKITQEASVGGSKTQDATRPSIATRSTKEEPQPSSGPVVQVGAYNTKAAAQTGWATLQSQTEALNGVSHRIVKGQADIGTVYRLQATPGDLAAARALCSRLKSDGVACQVKN